MNQLEQLHQKIDHLLQVIEQQQRQLNALNQALRDTSGQCSFCQRWQIKEFRQKLAFKGHYILRCAPCDSDCYFDDQGKSTAHSMFFVIRGKHYNAFLNYVDNTTVVDVTTTYSADKEDVLKLDYTPDWNPTNVQEKVKTLLPFL